MLIGRYSPKAVFKTCLLVSSYWVKNSSRHFTSGNVISEVSSCPSAITRVVGILSLDNIVSGTLPLLNLSKLSTGMLYAKFNTSPPFFIISFI